MPSSFLSLSLDTSLRSSGRIRASRGIIFAVLPIQLCVRRKAAFNKSLIKGKQRGVVRFSRVVLVSSATTRETLLPYSLLPPSSLSLSPFLSFSLSSLFRSLSHSRRPVVLPRRDYGKAGLSARRRKEGTRERKEIRKKDHSCHAPMAPPKSTDSSLFHSYFCFRRSARGWTPDRACTLTSVERRRRGRRRNRGAMDGQARVYLFEHVTVLENSLIEIEELISFSANSLT